MRRSIASFVLMALTFVSVTLMMMRSARADIVIFEAQLFSSNEVPPVSNADAGAFGQVFVTLDTSTNIFRFDWSVQGVAAPSLILSHIHEAAAGVNGPVRIDSLITPANPVPVVNGSASFSRGNLPGPADVVQRLLANPAGFYFNIHSTLNPGGVVRGQLVRQATPAQVPTLSEWGAILMGLLIVAACVFFLARRSRTSMALAAGAPAPVAEGPIKAIDWPLLGKVTLYVEAGTVLALIVWSATPVDVAGAVTCGLALAFIIHL